MGAPIISLPNFGPKIFRNPGGVAAATFANLLLSGETDGWAIDGTDVSGTPAYVGALFAGWVSVIDTGTPANNLSNVPIDKSNVLNAGTSAKMVHWNSAPYLRWTPHNRVYSSEDFTFSGSSSGWADNGSPSHCSVSVNATTAPDGSATADSIVEDGASSGHGIYDTWNDSSLNGKYQTQSVYAKAGSRSWISIDDGYGSNGGWFDIGNGVVGTAYGTGVLTITSAGSGWYRCEMAWLTNHNDGNFGISIATGDTVSSYAGNGTGNIYIWGAQRNNGRAATPYLKTTNASRLGVSLDYDAAESKFGLLTEKAATNTHIKSEDFTVWVPDNLDVTANATTGPDGFSTADQVNESMTGTPSENMIYSNGLGGLDATVNPATISIYLKKGARNYVYIAGFYDTARFFGSVFDLNTGVLGESKVGGTSGTVVARTITNVGGGWYRCTVSGTIAGGNMSLFWLGVVPNASGNSYTNDGQPVSALTSTSAIFYAYGMQVEAGSVATSYMPTGTTNTTTRATDKVYALLSTMPSIASALSTYTQYKTLAHGAIGASAMIGLENGNGNEATDEYDEFAGNGKLNFSVTVGGSAQAFMTGIVSPAVGTAHKTADSCASNSYNHALNGSTDTRDTSGSWPPSATDFFIGYGKYDANYQGNQRNYYLVALPRAMNDTELQSKST